MRHRPLVVLTLAALAIVPAVGQQQAAGQQQQSQQPPDQQRPPVFRAGTNLVQVDAFPSRDGRIVEGLTAADFEILEDGKPQTIEDVQFIRIDMNTPIAERLDPNTQAEANRLAADPRNRVFVIYLDHYHTDLSGSYRTRRPIVDMLNRMLTATDLFGVMTPLLRPADLILGRRTETLEDQLAKHWTWGVQGSPTHIEPDEEMIKACEINGYPIDIGRRRQEKLFDSLMGLVEHLGRLREARKVLLLFSRGWPEYRPVQRSKVIPARPRVGVTSTGDLTTTAPADGRLDGARCNAEALRLDLFDSFQRMRDLLEAANRSNVSIYPVNPAGLEAASTLGSGSLTRSWDDVRDRWQLLLTLAENTDGIAVGSNDMAADLRRVADDVSAYYVLSYYSTNTKMDGKYRRIQVKMKPPGVSVKARRGYTAPAEVADSAGRAIAERTTPAEVDEALAALTRLRASAEIFSYAVALPREIAVAVELPADRAFTGRWASGADVEVVVADSTGAEIGRASGRVEPPVRSRLLRVALPPGSRGPWAVSARVGDGAGSLADRLEVPAAASVLVGQPLLFRARPPASAPLAPAADSFFRRTERLHVDWPLLDVVDRREARVLGRNGAPLAIPLTVAERVVDGQAMLSIDLNLSPLTEADYLIDLTVGRGEATERKLVAFRVVR